MFRGLSSRHMLSKGAGRTRHIRVPITSPWRCGVVACDRGEVLFLHCFAQILMPTHAPCAIKQRDVVLFLLLVFLSRCLIQNV